MRRSTHILAACLLASAVTVSGCSDEKTAQSDHAAPAIVLAGRVTDEADILTPDQEKELSDTLTAFEARTKHQLVVVIAKSLHGENIGSFTLKLARAWGIGRRCYNDGVVVLVAPNERKVRIEVGLGLEKTLPNALCKDIIDTDMVPRFRENDYFGGIGAGTRALIARMP